MGPRFGMRRAPRPRPHRSRPRALAGKGCIRSDRAGATAAAFAVAVVTPGAAASLSDRRTGWSGVGSDHQGAAVGQGVWWVARTTILWPHARWTPGPAAWRPPRRARTRTRRARRQRCRTRASTGVEGGLFGAASEIERLRCHAGGPVEPFAEAGHVRRDREVMDVGPRRLDL